MQININQKPISFGDKYKVFIEGEEVYNAHIQLFESFPVIHLTESKSDRRIIISKKFSWFKARYGLTLWDGNALEFKTWSAWKRHFQCNYGSDLYEVYGHKGRKYSVYKNGKQVAWWEKSLVTWFAGDNYKVVADGDCDIQLIVSFCIIIDNYYNNNNGNTNTVNFDLGNIGPEAKVFDHNWHPFNN
jgi:uncharacterized protein YxjI